MKATTLIIIVLLGVIAYGLFQGRLNPSASLHLPVATTGTGQKSNSELTWEPVEKTEIGPSRQYGGVIQRHFDNGTCLLIHCEARPEDQMAPSGDYVLVDCPTATAQPDGGKIAFTAHPAGTTSYLEKPKQRRSLVRLYWDSGEADARVPAKPGSWMWKSGGTAVDRKAY